jgi:hypothetical protein
LLRKGFFILKCQGADGANVNAFSALAAHQFAKGFVLESRDHSFDTPSGKANGSDTYLFLANPDAFAAEDTFVRIVDKKRTASINGKVSFESSESLRLKFCPKVFDDLPKLAGSFF